MRFSTVADNVALGLPLDADRLAEALRAAALDEDVRALPQGADTPLAEHGQVSARNAGERRSRARPGERTIERLQQRPPRFSFERGST